MRFVHHRLLYVVNDAAFFVRHRLGHVAEAVAEGYDVHVAVPDGPGIEKLVSDGGTLHALPLSRGKAGPVSEIATISALSKLYLRLRPELVHHISVKPVLYGTIVARTLGIPAVVNTIPGLGWLFTGEDSAAAIRRRAAVAAYRFALRHPHMRVIVQNPDDKSELLHARIAKASDVIVIDGAGIDLDEFAVRPRLDGAPLIVLPARMLRDKGVVEFVDAARAMRGRSGARFALVGGIDQHNPAALSEETIHQWVAEGVVEWWGHRDDMPSIFAQAAFVVLPSYREGMPRTLMEAAASGRAVVTTDVPGCRQAVVNGETGLLVPPRDAVTLADAMKTLLDNLPLQESMGIAARALAVQRWDINAVIAATFRVYRDVLKRA